MKISAWLFASTVLLLVLATLPIASAAKPAAAHGVDLGIATNPLLDRPAIRVAWRNSQEILQVEVAIQNRGDQAGTGKLFLEIVDDAGNVLVRAPEIGQEVEVAIPANQDGSGQECQISIPGTRNLNHFFDRLDRMGRAYHLRATVQTEGADLNPLDNAATKSYNVNFLAVPGIDNAHSYFLENTTDQPLEVEWLVEASSTASDWEISTSPASGDAATIPANGAIQGQVAFAVPLGTAEGTRGNFNVRAINRADGTVVFDDEWFVVYSTTPPTVLDHEFTVKRNMIEVGVLATDEVVGVKEASGVSVEYSTDGGVTYSTRVAQYLDGDFFAPTSFKAELGPFAPGTEVAMSVAVTNGVGNVTRLPEATVSIPSDE